MQPRQFLLLLPAGLLLGLASSCSRSPSPPTAEPAPAALGIGLAAPIPLEESAAALPALGAYLDEVKTALASDRPVVGVEDAASTDPARRAAVTLALADLRFARDFVHRDTGEPLHNEILRAEPDPAAGGQIRVEMYNYFYNYSTVAWVDSAAKKVARVEEISATPPVVSPRLEALATQLTLRHPDQAVRAAQQALNARIVGELEEAAHYLQQMLAHPPGVRRLAEPVAEHQGRFIATDERHQRGRIEKFFLHKLADCCFCYSLGSFANRVRNSINYW